MTDTEAGLNTEAREGGAADYRAVIVAGVGLFVVLVVAVAAFVLVPRSVPVGKTSNGQNVVAVASAAFTAVAAVVSAYFGVRAANAAREGTQRAAEQNQQAAEQNQQAHQKAQERDAIRLSALSGAADSESAKAALNEAADHIKQLGLEP